MLGERRKERIWTDPNIGFDQSRSLILDDTKYEES